MLALPGPRAPREPLDLLAPLVPMAKMVLWALLVVLAPSVHPALLARQARRGPLDLLVP